MDSPAGLPECTGWAAELHCQVSFAVSRETNKKMVKPTKPIQVLEVHDELGGVFIRIPDVM